LPAFRQPVMVVGLMISLRFVWARAVSVAAMLFVCSVHAQFRATENFSVEVSAVVQAEPPQILLNWVADTNAISYQLRRKRPSDAGWGASQTLPGSSTAFLDQAASVGEAFEYQIIKQAQPNYTGYGYILAGIQAPLQDDRGKLILLVSQSSLAGLQGELDLLEQDLVGDGWQVLRHDIPAGMAPAEIKQIIQSDYAADPAAVQALFLLGNITVPYSGDIFPDGHENHRGAWPADVYYADVDGVWTDNSVISTNAERQINWNLPGDGKFDQSWPPSPVELMVGRVDLSNLTDFANKTPSRSEQDLLRAYLAKNHAFRHRLFTAERRALVCDIFFDKGDDPIAGSAWRNYVAYFGRQNIVNAGWDEYFPKATATSFLCAYGSGGGSYTYAQGIGSADEFALQNLQVVFAMFTGSYFGDWNNESNFLRSSLGSGTVLTAIYAGFPHIIAHRMALGGSVGEAIRLTQNNPERGTYPPYNPHTAAEVHISLLGDPTLRLHPVIPPSNVTVGISNGGIVLNWAASADSSLAGYHVYRATSASGPFVRITGNNPLPGLSFFDDPPAGRYVYMVRAIKLESSASGTYFNASQGSFVEIEATQNPGGDSTVAIASAGFADGQFRVQAVKPLDRAVVLEFSSDLTHWTGLQTNSTTATQVRFDDSTATAAHRFYRLRLF